MAWAAYMLTRVAAVLADQPVALAEPLVQLPARSRALPLGRAARRDPVGRELPAGAGRRSPPRGQDPGPAGRRRLRREHGRRDRRLADGQPAARRRGSAPSTRSRSSIVISALSALLMLASAGGGRRSEEAAVPVRRHAAARGGDGRRRAARADRAAGPRRARRLRPLRGHAARRRRTSSTWARAGTRRSPCRGCRNGVLNYHNAGKVQASSEPQDMRLQRMLGHLTTLIPKKPEVGARHRLRRGRDGRRRVDRSRRRST